MASLIINEIENEEKLFEELKAAGIVLFNFVEPRYNGKKIISMSGFGRSAEIFLERSFRKSYPTINEQWLRDKVLKSKSPRATFIQFNRLIRTEEYTNLYLYIISTYINNQR